MLQKKPLVIGLSVVALLIAFGVIVRLLHLAYPMRPLYVGFDNRSGTAVISIRINHGNVNTQEKIQLLQLQAGEKRYVALNHEPKMGFDVEINYSDGRQFNACIGKFSESWHLKVVIEQSGVDIIEVW